MTMTMTPNPLLRRLGYSDNDRVVILHVDDVGMCQSSIQAFDDLWDFGTISSGAVMVPCPWFAAAADWARAHPDADLGVHATLNAEWAGYRWRPVASLDTATGLMDGDGYFYDDPESTWAHADPVAVRHEVETQVERALAAGIDITHIDTHMLALSHPKLAPGYVQTLRRFRVPGLVPRDYAAQLARFDVPDDGKAAGLIDGLSAGGFPLIDAIDYMPLDDPEDQVGLAIRKLRALPAGITHFLMHPAIDTPELRAMAPDWPSRVANYEAFMSRELKTFLKESGIQVIGYRPLRDLLRATSG